MKKKGFTLVELLAVIAILAILVIIALPNIMDLFNKAKQNSFENEVKEIYKTAQSQWMSDSLNGGGAKRYAKGSDGPDNSIADCTEYQLSLTGRDDIQYGVSIDSTGKVIELAVTDGTYESYTSNDNGFGIEDINPSTPASEDNTGKVICDDVLEFGFN